MIAVHYTHTHTPLKDDTFKKKETTTSNRTLGIKKFQHFSQAEGHTWLVIVDAIAQKSVLWKEGGGEANNWTLLIQCISFPTLSKNSMGDIHHRARSVDFCTTKVCGSFLLNRAQ